MPKISIGSKPFALNFHFKFFAKRFRLFKNLTRAADIQMSETFVPGPDNQRALRDALGRFVTGVTVITAVNDEGPVGITANSFTSLSLDPPLILWCPAKASDRYEPMIKAAYFAVHILDDSQRDLAQTFAESGNTFDTRWQRNAQNVPVLDDCLCRLDCALVTTHDAGDHAIFIGEVERVQMRSGAPLIFAGGKFGDFTPRES